MTEAKLVLAGAVHEGVVKRDGGKHGADAGGANTYLLDRGAVTIGSPQSIPVGRY